MDNIELYGYSVRQDDGTYKHYPLGYDMFGEVFADTIGRGKEEVAWKQTWERIDDEASKGKLSYYRTIIRDAALLGLRRSGYNITTVGEADDILRMMFLYERYWDCESHQELKRPKTLKGIGQQDMEDFILKCQQFLLDELDMTFTTYEEYISKFTKKIT